MKPPESASAPVEPDWLRGIRVLLYAHYLPAPTAAWLLRMLGAEVIKVEPPYGDLLRAQGPPLSRPDGTDMSAYFRAVNAGFKSIALDLSQETGRKAMQDLIAQSDVLLDGSRPGKLAEKLGSSPGTWNPDLVYLPVSAFGQQGPLRDQAGHDANALAVSGLLSYGAPAANGGPAAFGTPVADLSAGYLAALMAVAAVLGKVNRNSQLETSQIDVSMLHASFFMQQIQVAGMAAGDPPPAPGREWMNGALPNYRAYRCQDGRYVFLAALEPHLFGNFCHSLEMPEWLPMLRTEPATLHHLLEQRFLERPLSAWMEQMQAVDCCLSPVLNLREALDHPHVRALNLAPPQDDPDFGSLRLAGFPAALGPEGRPIATHFPAPGLGEHTREVLQDILGYEEASIAGMLASGAAIQADQAAG